MQVAKSDIIVFFPTRRLVPYVASTDRVFTFMSRIAEEVSKEFPDKLLACYAYGNYTVPPVRTVPHKNLMILSVAGIYSMERNVAAWRSFGNDIGRFTARKRIGRPSKPTPEEDAAFRKMAKEYIERAAFKAKRLGI